MLAGSCCLDPIPPAVAAVPELETARFPPHIYDRVSNSKSLDQSYILA